MRQRTLDLVQPASTSQASSAALGVVSSSREQAFKCGWPRGLVSSVGEQLTVTTGTGNRRTLPEVFPWAVGVCRGGCCAGNQL